MGSSVELDDEAELCAEIVYRSWREGVENSLDNLEEGIDGNVSGRVVNPEWIDFYFTPFITQNYDDVSVEESIRILLKLYLEDESDVWNSWNEYTQQFDRKYGRLSGEKVHTFFIPDPMLHKMIEEIEASTQYSVRDFEEFRQLFSLQENYSVDEINRGLMEAFNEVLIHEISHWVLHKYCDKNSCRYNSTLGEALGWFLDHEIYDENTYHLAGRDDSGDLGIGTFSGYDSLHGEEEYTLWLTEAFKSAFGMQEEASHPYTWSNILIAKITSKGEITKEAIFSALVPGKFKSEVEELEQFIETEYNATYQELLELIEVSDEDIRDLKDKAMEYPEDKEELLDRKRFYDEVNQVKLRIEEDTELMEPVQLEAVIERELNDHDYNTGFSELLARIHERIESIMEKEVKEMRKAVGLCERADEKMSQKGIGEINGEYIDERKQFKNKFMKLKNHEETLEQHLESIEARTTN